MLPKEYAGGSGTEDDPYLIETPEQLAKIAKDADAGNDFLDVYFLIVADLDMGAFAWEPIGGCSLFGEQNLFMGIIDGGWHKLTNLTINDTGVYRAGLVNELGGEIRNLTIESGSVVGLGTVGSFASMCTGLIENCVNKADVQATEAGAGGFVGSLRPSTVGTGVVGTVRNCVNYGNVTVTSYNGLVAGGIVAELGGNVEGCANYGFVTSNNSIAGGIAGNMRKNGEGMIADCYNVGAVMADGESAGGLIGQIFQADLTVVNFYNAANITALVADSYHAFCGTIPSPADDPVMPYCYNNTDYCNLRLMPGKWDHQVPDTKQMTTEEMASQDFVDLPNAQAMQKGLWAMDEGDVNGGMPVFAYQLEEHEPVSGIGSVASEAAVKVWAADGAITVDGAGDAEVRVYTVAGMLTFAGSADELAGRAVDAGVYVVSVGGVSRKVMVD